VIGSWASCWTLPTTATASRRRQTFQYCRGCAARHCWFRWFVRAVTHLETPCGYDYPAHPRPRGTAAARGRRIDSLVSSCAMCEGIRCADDKTLHKREKKRKITSS
jgi:hypothetical protein